MNKFRKGESKRRISLLLSMVMFLSIVFSGTPLDKVFAEGNNLVVNGDLEQWSGAKPTGWSGRFENAVKGSKAHSGSSSIQQTSSSGTKDVATLVKGIVPGQEYTISFWYFDGDENAKCRPWMSWKKDDGKYSEAVTPEDKKILQPTKWLDQNGAWTQWKVKLTAPSDASSFNFEIRVNKEVAAGGVVFYDDLFIGIEGPIAPPTKVGNVFANPESGKVMAGTEVELNTATTGTAIYYSIGSEALTTTESAIRYTQPIEINENTEIHTVAVKEGLENSEEAVYNYEIFTDADFDKIYDIQGMVHTSTYVGDKVTVVGVVTGISTDKYDAGVYIQDIIGDGNDKTSDGIFVRGKGIKANIGDKLLVEGTVQEKLKYPASGNDDAGQLGVTEIVKFNTTVIESGLDLPEPIVLGDGGRTLITDIVDNDNFADFDPEQDAIDLYESLEGMLVKINNPHIVGVQERYGTFDVLADNGFASQSKLNPRGGIKITKENVNPEILHVDDVVTPLVGSLKTFYNPKYNMAKVGDTFADSIIGVMDYNFGLYKIYNTVALPDIVPGVNDRETTTIQFANDKLTVAVYNVENFAADSTQTPDEKVERIANSIINELGTPDILSLVEVQDNNGPSKEGDSEANESYERLINKIIAEGGPTYSYTDIAPVMNEDGGQPGGNIRVGYIYLADRVDFTGTKGGQTEAATMNGTHLAKNPSRVDPTNADFVSTRKSLVGEFVFNGESVFLISNHFNSKRGDEPDFGNAQPPIKGSEAKRHGQARAVNAFVKEILAADADAKVVVLGDMNDYEYSETLNLLKGTELTNILDKLPEVERYTYVYGGNIQVLDNMLVSNSMVDDTIVDVVHVNAEFTEHSGRASDHDPVVIQISNVGSADYIKTVNFSQKTGFVEKGSTLELTTDQVDGEILYTVGFTKDSTEDPKTNGAAYTEAIQLDECRPYYVKAVVKKDGKYSEVMELELDVDFAILEITPEEYKSYEGTVIKATSSKEGVRVLYTSDPSNYDTSTYEEFPAEGITLTETVEIKFVLEKDGEYGAFRVSTFNVIPEVEISTIADAKAKADGERVKVQGIVTGKIGNNIFIQDNTAGLYVFVGGSAREEFVVGNELELVGYTAQFNDLKQIKNIQKVKKLSEGNDLPDAEVVSVSAIDESKEGKLVKVKNLSITTVAANKTKGYTIKASDGINTLDLRIDKYLDFEIDSNQYSAGMYIEVTAPVGQFKTTYQLMIRTADDIVKVLGPVADSKKIYEIQGEVHTSPLVGQKVRTQGVVTAVSGDKYDAGIYIQDAAGDGNDNTSDGIFVRGKGITAVVGDIVEVEGTVVEKLKYPAKGNDDAGQLSITEIAVTKTTVLQSGQQVPAPIVLGQGGRTLITDIVDNDNFADFDPEQDAIDLYESLEGMLVKINNPHIVGVQERYGTFDVLADNGAASQGKMNPRGGIKITKENVNPEVLHVDDVVTPATGSDKTFIDSKYNMAKVGDKFDGSITGVMDYNFGLYKIYNIAALPSITPGINERETTTIQYAEDKLTVAVYNVENFAADAGQTPDEKVERIANSIINELGTPDILSLVEVQDNNGPSKEGDSEANESYERLINKIVELGGPTYSYTDIAPVMNQDGGQPGGNIRVGYIYRADRVGFTGTKGGQTENATMNGTHLAKNPSRIDPTNTSFQNTRKSLVGEFVFNGESVFIISNHFNSKRGDAPDFGNVQPPVKGSEPKRHGQARAVNTFVKEILAADANAKVVVLGDMNDYEYSETLNVLKGSELTNMFETLPEVERYTYVYGGNIQVLDNMLVSNSMVGDTIVDVVHVNAEFTEHSGRASDHDPVVIQIGYLGVENDIKPAEFTKAGFIETGSTVEFTTEQAGAEIYFTRGDFLNPPKNPIIHGTLYTGAIELNECGFELFKVVVKKDGRYGEVVKAEYTVDFGEIELTPADTEVYQGTAVSVEVKQEGVNIYYSTEQDNYDKSTYTKLTDKGIVINEATRVRYVLEKDGVFGIFRSVNYTIKPEVEVSTIAEVIAKPNKERVRIRGIVTADLGYNIFIQDETAGLYVYVEENEIEEFVVGNELEIVGIKDEFHGLRQINNVKKITKISEGNKLPEAELITLSQLDETREGKIVRVENLVITYVPEDKTKSYSIYAGDGDNTVSLRFDRHLKQGIDSNNYEVGMIVNVTAPVGQFKERYQLMISKEEDIDVIPYDPKPAVFSENNTTLIIGETLSIYSEEESAEIYYTISNTYEKELDPRTVGTLYTEALTVPDGHMIVNAVVKKNGFYSEVVRGFYTGFYSNINMTPSLTNVKVTKVDEGEKITVELDRIGVEAFYKQVQLGERNFPKTDEMAQFPADGLVVEENMTLFFCLKKDGKFQKLKRYYDVEVVKALSPEEAKLESEGTIVNVRGIVTAIIEDDLYVQEGDKAIFVHDQAYGAYVGDKIVLTGEITKINGIAQLEKVTDVKVISKNNELPEAADINISSIYDYDGKKVKLDTVEILNFNHSKRRFEIKEKSETIKVLVKDYIEGDINVKLMNDPVVSLTGMVNKIDGEYQININQVSDIKIFETNYELMEPEIEGEKLVHKIGDTLNLISDEDAKIFFTEDTYYDPRVKLVRTEYVNPIELTQIGKNMIKAVAYKEEQFSRKSYIYAYGDYAILRLTPEVKFTNGFPFTDSEYIVQGTNVKAEVDETDVEIYYSFVAHKDMRITRVVDVEDSNDRWNYDNNDETKVDDLEFNLYTDGIEINEDTGVVYRLKKNGVFSSVIYIADYKTRTTPPNPTLTNIVDLKNLKFNEEAKIKGFIVGRYDEYFYVQDETGSVRIEGSYGYDLDLLNEYEFTILNRTFDGNEKYTIEGYKPLFDSTSIVPETITIDVIDKDKDMKLVKLENLTITEVNLEDKFIMASDGTNTIKLDASDVKELAFDILKSNIPINLSDYKVGMIIDVIAPIKFVDEVPTIMISTEFNIIPEGTKDAPVRVMEVSTYSQKVNEEGNIVAETKESFGKNETILVKTKLHAMNSIYGTVILKITGPDNHVQFISYEGKKIDYESFNSNEISIGTSLQNAKAGEYTAKVMVWRSMDSQRVLAETKEVKFTITE